MLRHEWTFSHLGAKVVIIAILYSRLLRISPQHRYIITKYRYIVQNLNSVIFFLFFVAIIYPLNETFLHFSLFRSYSFQSLFLCFTFPVFYFLSISSVLLYISSTFFFSFCLFVCCVLPFLVPSIFLLWLSSSSNFSFCFYLFLCVLLCLSSIIFPLLFSLSFCVFMPFFFLSFLSSCSSFLYFLSSNFLSVFPA